jgi:predicted helicase
MSLSLKPTHATVKAYYETLHQFGQLYIDHEGAVRSAFQTLLAKCGQRATPKLTLVPEYRIERARSSVIVDGALVDLYHLPHGYWEAKDEKDDLVKEVERKLDKGYPRDNIIFQAPERAILYQSGARILDADISRPEPLVEVVNTFFDYKAPHIQEWEEAVRDFSERIPELATAVKKTIDEERRKNPSFVRSFEDFYALCRQAINPNLSQEAVERMLVQHLLTERIFRKIFNNPDFSRRNVVAAEIEKVISELTKRAFNRDEFLSGLDRFYRAVEQSAENTTGFSEKQAFLNKVYERFFQGYSPKEADTHGIVYTPQPIVNFMVRSVEEILQKEFGRSLSDKSVHILDPFVGTGNFIVRIMQEIKTTDLPYKYENELHCNEVMLLPYYIASMNIEHAYFERTGEYKPFPGICLVDTFDMAAHRMFTEKNTERIEAQLKCPIFVAIGNPPYNAWQVDENDNNKNRKYGDLDDRVSETYAKASRATNKNALSDPYVKAIRWASDRIGAEGIVALVTNSGFVDGLATDGMRAHLAADFDRIYVLDLGGNVRKNPKLSGTTHNVFGIQVGVSINLFVRRNVPKEQRLCKIYYAASEKDWTRWKKYSWLEEVDRVSGVQWSQLQPDAANRWLSEGGSTEFGALPSMEALFAQQSRGIATSRDAWAYNFDRDVLVKSAQRTISFYNDEVSRWKGRKASDTGTDIGVDKFVRYDESSIGWSRDLKQDLQRERCAEFSDSKIRSSLYRPFTQLYTFFDRVLNEEVYVFPSFVPGEKAERENGLICLTGPGSEKPFVALVSHTLVDLHLTGAGCSTQCFPFYTYAEDGTHRRENVTDWALEQFRSRYGDASITKWDIFHYVYAVLHHPEYRERYAANLRRELPRIPFAATAISNGCHSESGQRPGEEPASAQGTGKQQVPHRVSDSVRNDKTLRGVDEGQRAANLDIFRAFVRAGRRLAEIHVQYEKQPEYPLRKTEKPGEKLDYRVTRMKLSKDKTSLIYNQFLTLSGIPPETYEYRLGNRSALEWVIDQYQVSTDKRSGITNDPNRDDDPQYILRLVGQVVTVSLETVKIVRSLPSLGLPE